MNCANHPEKEAAGSCVYCGKLYCQECLVEVDGKNYCRSCLTKAFQDEKNKSQATPSINIVNTNSNVNTNQNIIGGRYGNPKNKWVSLLLCIFTICGHKFYEGKPGMGFVYLFTGGLLGIGWLLDILRILSKPNPYYI